MLHMKRMSIHAHSRRSIEFMKEQTSRNRGVTIIGVNSNSSSLRRDIQEVRSKGTPHIHHLSLPDKRYAYPNLHLLYK